MRIKGLNLSVILRIFTLAIVFGTVFTQTSFSAQGLSVSGNQVLYQGSDDLLGIVEAGDDFGSALSSGDFNNDGYVDLAIGVPNDDIGSTESAGAVNVLYGTAEGLSALGNQWWNQGSDDLSGESEAGDDFGSALSSGDFNNDGYGDLAIGVPNDDIEGIESAGAVNVLYGTAEGLSALGSQWWNQDSDDLSGESEAGDGFGSALSTGDFNNDGYTDLAIGVPDEAIGSTDNAGMVNVLYGSENGLSASGEQGWHQDSSGISGAPEANDRFGAVLSTGDFNNDGYADLAIGVPSEDIESVTNAGMVNILYGSENGLSASGDQGWHQNISGIPGESEANDRFGASLSTGDYNNDGYGDLAIGVLLENIEGVTCAGMVNVLYGSENGLSVSAGPGCQEWHQHNPGISDDPEWDEHFGASLSSGDFNNDGYGDLAIGVPHEHFGSIEKAGMVNVLYGSGKGLSVSAGPGCQEWHQDSPGISDDPEAGDWFGYTLSSGDFNNNGYADLAIGIPREDIESVTDAGMVNVLYGDNIKDEIKSMPWIQLLLDD